MISMFADQYELQDVRRRLDRLNERRLLTEWTLKEAEAYRRLTQQESEILQATPLNATEAAEQPV